jgi:hypothetical protein
VTNPLTDLLLKNQQLQRLRIENVDNLLMLTSQDVQVQTFDRLRVLEFTIQSRSWEVNSLSQTLVSLIHSASGLQKLGIVWEDLCKGGSNDAMVLLISIASKLLQPLVIDLKTAEEEISMTIQNNNDAIFKDAHLQVSSVAMAEKHPLVWQKALRTLTIKERENLGSTETRTNLTRILGLNPGLTTLYLEYWAVEFQTAGEAIKTIAQSVPCGLTKVVIKDCQVNGVEGELSVIMNLKDSKGGNSNEENAMMAEVRAFSYEEGYPTTRQVNDDNDLFYLNYGPLIRNMRLGKRRQNELNQYLYGIMGQGRVDLITLAIYGYRRIHLTCLAIHGYWEKLGQVLELSRSSLKLLAVREKPPLLHTVPNTTSDKISAVSPFGFSRIAEFFRGDRLVMIHQNSESDDEVRKKMAPSRTVVTFASDEEAWDMIVSELFNANKL